MKLLPKELIRIEPSYDGVHIIASLYEHPVGYCWWDKYTISDLPNDLISLDDLKCFGINTINMEACGSKKTL